MKVSIGQIYNKPGVSFPFSHLMQRWLAKELSAITNPSAAFVKKYGADFRLTIRVSADTQIADCQVKGPAVFKKDKGIEYSVYLPFDTIVADPRGCRAAVEFLVAGIRSIFEKIGADPTELDKKRGFIVDHICSDPTMLSEPWPYG